MSVLLMMMMTVPQGTILILAPTLTLHTGSPDLTITRYEGSVAQWLTFRENDILDNLLKICLVVSNLKKKIESKLFGAQLLLQL